MATNYDDDFDGLVAQALNRMDTKGEAAAEAAEAVTGGNRELDAKIVRALQGEPVGWALDANGHRFNPTLATLTRAVARLEATDTRNPDGSLTEETEEACELLEIGLYSIIHGTGAN